MHLDHFFSKGKGHAVCQDYAVSGMSPVPYAFISDGCSSSLNSEIGAMLLCRMAAERSSVFSELDRFEQSILFRIKTIGSVLALKEESLDATLVGICVDEKIVNISAWGDGHIIFIKKNGNIHIISIAYESNAPFYLSYLESHRQKIYIDRFGLMKKIISNSICSFGSNIHETFLREDSLFERISIPVIAGDYACILVASDGLSSFVEKKEDGASQPVLAEKVIIDLVSFKSSTGEFIKRRLNRLLRDYEKKGIFPLDDISVAGVWLGD